MNHVKSEPPAEYSTGLVQPAEQTAYSAGDLDILRQAEAILVRGINQHGDALTSPAATKKLMQCRLSGRERECFAVLFLDQRNRVIAFEEIFYGTIDGATVHPREVVKRALAHNAAAVIFAHNHPSGVPEPSRADQTITKRLKDALAIVDVRTLDHIVVGDTAVSMAERGLM